MSQSLLAAIMVIPTGLVVIALFAIMWRERTSGFLVPLAFMVHFVSLWQLRRDR